MDTVTWTDEKLNAVDGKVDALDTKMDALDTRVGVLEKKVDIGFVRTDERFKAVGERLDEVNRQLRDLKSGQAQMNDRFDAKFDAFNRTLLQIGGGMIGTLIAGIVTLIAVVLTH